MLTHMEKYAMASMAPGLAGQNGANKPSFGSRMLGIGRNMIDPFGSAKGIHKGIQSGAAAAGRFVGSGAAGSMAQRGVNSMRSFGQNTNPITASRNLGAAAGRFVGSGDGGRMAQRVGGISGLLESGIYGKKY